MTVKLSFQTLHLPPPFAYAYTLGFTPDDEGLQVSFHHEYLHRDQITTDEVLEEGYSENDDFSWEGTLPEVWKTAIDKLLAQTKTKDVRPDDEFLENYLHLDVEESDLQPGYPENVVDWQYTLQELIQAIYELSQKEKPFYLAILDQSSRQEVEIHATFAHRQLEVRRTDSSQPQNWQLLAEVLRTLENMSLPLEGKDKPQKKGIWLTFDGEVYYQLQEEEARKLLALIGQ